MNLNNLTIKVQEAFQRAQQIVIEGGQQALELGHIFKGVLDVDDSVTPFVFKKMGVNYQVVKQATDSIVDSYPKVSGGNFYFSRPATEAISRASIYLKEFGDE